MNAKTLLTCFLASVFSGHGAEQAESRRPENHPPAHRHMRLENRRGWGL